MAAAPTMYVTLRPIDPDGSHEKLLLAINPQGVVQWQVPVGEDYPGVIAADEFGVLIADSEWTGVYWYQLARVTADGVQWIWTWDRNRSIRDIAPDGRGGAYLAFPTHMATPEALEVYHIDDAGVGSLLASHAFAALGLDYGDSLALALSRDGSVLHVLHIADTDSTTTIVAVDTASGAVLWQHEVMGGENDYNYARLRRVPGSDSLIVAYAPGANPDSMVARLDFPHGVTSAPTPAWSTRLSQSHTYFAGIAVTSTRAAVGFYNYDDLTRVACLDLADGGVLWQVKPDGVSATPYGIDINNGSVAATNDHIVIGAFFAELEFPTNESGFIRLDIDTGAVSHEGVFSLEAVTPIGAVGYTPESIPAAAVPRLDSPVTLHFSEALTGVFADPTVDATFFQLVDLPVGSRYALGDQISSDDWYAFAVRDKSISGGLVTYAGETLLATLGRVTPTESLILVAGQGGVPTPLTLRECLIRFLTYYGVPFDPDVPEFSLRVGDELVTPTADAFVIQPNQENPESIYEWLERFFGPFRGYTFRADALDRLVITPPAWLDTIGLRLTVHRRRQPLDREPVRSTVRAPWSTSRAPTVEWVGTVDGVAVSGSLPDPLVQGAAAEIVTVGGIDVRLTWDAAVVQAMVWPPPDVDVSVGSLYSVTFVFRPSTLASSSESLALTLADLTPDEVTSESADTVVNQAVLPVRRREFTPAQQVMQAGALVLRSPKQVMAGAFGANPEYGPMAEPLATPGSFLELANTVGQSGTWFWPADPLVVAQPGGNITVAFEVEEWAERWYDPTLHDAAAQVNTYSGSAALPASGVEVKLFDFQFPRQTNDFAPSPYGAQGSVYGRWRAGEQPGIEVRVGNARFAEFGFKPEVLIFGSTTYYLWGFVLRLNGTGTAFTEGTLETYRFGFARGANGLWEDDANVPGLSESQSLYPNRVYHAPELPYVVSPETALALARGIVEENLTPKVVRQLTIVPAHADGYAVRPHHVGRAAAVPALGITGRITALDYSEAHTAQGSTSSLTIDVESTEAPSGSRAAARTYSRSAYGLSTYQAED